MKKELILGTSAVPTRIEGKTGKKFRELLNGMLPEGCQVKTAKDAWYAGAIGALCITFVFPPALLASVYCVARAKREGGAR